MISGINCFNREVDHSLPSSSVSRYMSMVSTVNIIGKCLCWHNVDETATLLESGEVRVLFGRTLPRMPTERNEKILFDAKIPSLL